MTISEISKIILAKPLNKIIIIGVEGFGGCGKTTIAHKLGSSLATAHVISMDDFIVKDKLLEPLWDGGSFDYDRLEQEVLVPATDNQPIRYKKLLWESNTLSKPETIPLVDYLIIEGISSYHPKIAHYYDYRIWVDTPIEISKKRGRARDNNNNNNNAQHWDLWADNDLAYQQLYHSELVADFTIKNY